MPYLLLVLFLAMPTHADDFYTYDQMTQFINDIRNNFAGKTREKEAKKFARNNRARIKSDDMIRFARRSVLHIDAMTDMLKDYAYYEMHRLTTPQILALAQATPSMDGHDYILERFVHYEMDRLYPEEVGKLASKAIFVDKADKMLKNYVYYESKRLSADEIRDLAKKADSSRVKNYILWYAREKDKAAGIEYPRHAERTLQKTH